MLDFNLIKEDVNNILKEENNEVVYRAWLFYFENSVLEDDNIVINVPNIYTKNILEERYLLGIEELYREKLSFKNIVVSVNESLVFENINSCNSIDDNTSVFEDIVEKINYQVKKVYEFIENAANSGLNSISYMLPTDWVINEEVYFRLKEFMSSKGFKAELNNQNNNYTLCLSW